MSANPPQSADLRPRTWAQSLKVALEKYGLAREASLKAQLTIGLPRSEKDAAAQAELDAEEEVARVNCNAAQDLLIMLRTAVKLFPDDFRDLLRQALAKPERPRTEHEERSEAAIALYLRIKEAGAVVSSDGVKNVANLSSLDRKLIPLYKDELLKLAKPA